MFASSQKGLFWWLICVCVCAGGGGGEVTMTWAKWHPLFPEAAPKQPEFYIFFPLKDIFLFSEQSLRGLIKELVFAEIFDILRWKVLHEGTALEPAVKCPLDDRMHGVVGWNTFDNCN